jgi:hypothetical protein
LIDLAISDSLDPGFTGVEKPSTGRAAAFSMLTFIELILVFLVEFDIFILVGFENNEWNNYFVVQLQPF